MLGQSEESNSEFSYCSEKAYAERIKAREEKEKKEKAQQEAAAQAVKDAAKNLEINNTIDAMVALDGCASRNSSTIDDEQCLAAVQAFTRKARAVYNYWDARVKYSGGLESKTNKLEQTNFLVANDVAQGVKEGHKRIYPDYRFDAIGNVLDSCTDTEDNTKWGDDCQDIYKKENPQIGYTCEGEAACNGDIKCCPGPGNTFDGTKCPGVDYVLTNTDDQTDCDLVPLKFGLFQW